MTLQVIITSSISFIAILVAIYTFKKNRRLQLQIFEYQKEKDRQTKQKELKESAFKNSKNEHEPKIYIEYIKNQFQYLDFTGLKAILQKPIKLENVYVRLKTIESRNVSQNISIMQNDVLQEINEPGSKAFADSLYNLFEKRIKVRSPERILIVGHPGSGKTTLMKWIALQCDNINDKFLYDYIPIFFSLKDFGKDPASTYKKFSIYELSRRLLQANGLPFDFLKKAFDETRLLFLLDGLDEVADDLIRLEIIEWIQRQNILRSLMIITSRYSGIQVSKGITFNSTVTVYEIQNFSRGDVAQFLDNWYKNVELAIDESENVDATLSKAARSSRDLIEVINSPDHKSLASLAVNPLLLTIIAIVHRTRAVLPKERHKLYEEAINVMIELWNISNKKIHLAFTLENCLSLLSTVAVYLMRGNVREIGKDELKEILPQQVEGKDIDVFLHEMLLKSGLIFLSEGKYGFLHLTFQEYLAARFFAKSSDQNAILEYINKDFWIETLRLFVNVGNTHSFFNILFQEAEAKNIKDVNFVLELALEIVVEEDREKYVDKALYLLLPELLNLKNNDADTQRILDLFYPSMGFYIKNIDKVTEVFLKLIMQSENYYAKAFSLVVLSHAELVCRRKVVAYLKGIILQSAEEYKVVILSKSNINQPGNEDGSELLPSTAEEQRLAKQFLDFVVLVYHTFTYFVGGTKEPEDISFVIDAMESEFDLLQYLGSLALRDFDELASVKEKFDFDLLPAIKVSSATETLKNEIRRDVLKAAENISSPKNFAEALSLDKFYTLEIRPLWQIENLLEKYSTSRKQQKAFKEKFSKIASSMKQKLHVSVEKGLK